MRSDFSVSVTLQSEEVKLNIRTMSYSNHATFYLLFKVLLAKECSLLSESE